MFSETLKSLRQKQGLTQEQLAEKLNVSRQAVAKWEAGTSLPDIENLKNISLLFHVSTDLLLSIEHEKNISSKEWFGIVAFCLFFLGICLGIVAGDALFGLVMAILLPCIVLAIEQFVLQRKYKRSGQILQYKQLLTSQMPKNFYGRLLDPRPKALKTRLRWYALESLLSSGLITLFGIVGAAFSKTSWPSYGLLASPAGDIAVSTLLNFLLTCLAFFLLDTLLYENVVRKYNKQI